MVRAAGGGAFGVARTTKALNPARLLTAARAGCRCERIAGHRARGNGPRTCSAAQCLHHWTAPTDPVQVGPRYGSCYRPGDGMQCLSTRAHANPVAWPPGWHQPVRRPEMHVIAELAGQQVQGANAALVLIAIVIVAFWRVLLRLLAALIAIAFVVLVGAGAIMLLHR